MERIKNAIADIKNDFKHLIYDLSSLIGYIHMDFDNELPDENFWDKEKRTQLYQKANEFLEALNEATFTKEYGNYSKKNIVNEMEFIYFEATNKGKQPKDNKAPWVDDKDEEEEEEQ